MLDRGIPWAQVNERLGLGFELPTEPSQANNNASE
jgi:hypothetical protein